MSEKEVKSSSAKSTGFPMGGGGRGRIAMGLDKPRDFKNTMNNLADYLKPFWISLIVVFVFTVASTIFAIISPKVLGNMTNQVVSDYADMKLYDQVVSLLPAGTVLAPGTKGSSIIQNLPAESLANIPADKQAKLNNLDFSKRPTINFEKLQQIALWLILLYLLSLVFDYTQGWVMTNVSQKVTYNFRRDISQKINRLPLKYFDKKSYGDVLSRVTNDVDTVSQSLNQSMTQIINSIVLIVGIFIMMLWINWMMTLVALLIIPMSFFTISVIIKKSQKYFKKQQDSLGMINGHIEEMYSGHLVMKAFNGEERSLKKFCTINDEMFDSAWKSQFYSFMMWPLVNLMGNLTFVGVSVVGGALAFRGLVNIGDIQAFILYVRQFNQPILQVANVANVLQSTAAAAERVFEFLAEEEEMKETKHPKKIKSIQGKVEFENVVFGYSPEKIVIHGLNLSALPGKRIAIVGPTGAGKTTLVNLLMRFYEVNEGKIKVDGIDIKELKRSELRRMFGMVLQDTWLFNGTIMENISYGKSEAKKEEVVAAAKAAHADQFIRTLPKGYDMILNEEANNISQGEKQLITIARAMLVNPSILILDEATSSVDTRTEVLIQEAMDKLMTGRTSFIIAHRLSTIRNADVILVMNEGQLIEQGSHEELIAKKGFYADLYKSQFLAPVFEEE